MTCKSREEYLKKYLSPVDSSEGLKKKRKKKLSKHKIKNGKGMRIVDDDVGWDQIEGKSDDDEAELKFLTKEELPQVAEVDERSQTRKEIDKYRESGKWKQLDNSGVSDNVAIQRRESFKRHDSDSDLDLPKRGAKEQKNDTIQVHPSSSSRHRHDSSSDSDLDVRRNIHSRTTNNRPKKVPDSSDSDSDLNIPRPKSNTGGSRNDSDSDLDVQRKRPSDISQAQKRTMEGGGKGGLTSVQSLRKELKLAKQKESDLQKVAKQYKSSKTVYRERGSGKRRDTEKEDQEQQEKDDKRRAKEDRYAKWGRGLKQATMVEEAVESTLHEANKPLARYRDDQDLDEMQRNEVRSEDPMAEYINRKRQREKAPGQKELPKYRGPRPAPNRYGIGPGYRWDGVDRSNGFESRYFISLNDRKTDKEDYHKWSIGDM